MQKSSMLTDIRGSSMLKRTSWFVLEVLPYLLSALIAAVVLPGFLYSQVHETKGAVTPNIPGLEVVHGDHVLHASDRMLSDQSAKTTEGKLAYR
jgi:hypothetical protein